MKCVVMLRVCLSCMIDVDVSCTREVQTGDEMNACCSEVGGHYEESENR